MMKVNMHERVCRDGRCVKDASIRAGSDEFTLRWPAGRRAAMVPGTKVIISRGGPDEGCGCKHAFDVKQQNGDSMVIRSSCHIPRDYAEGVWKVYAVDNDVQLWRLLWALKIFTTQDPTPLQTLICDEPDSVSHIKDLNKFLVTCHCWYVAPCGSRLGR